MAEYTYSITTPEQLRTLCISKNWFTNGSNSQYEKLFYANENGCPLDEIATIIWLCTDCEEYINEYGVHWCRRDIKSDLLDAQNAYHRACDAEALQERYPYEVYLQAGTVRKHFSEFETEQEAINFCESHNWCWIDENEFEWSMDYDY